MMELLKKKKKKLRYNKFKKYVELSANREDDSIDNTSWSTCAVGEYLKASGYSIQEGEGDIATLATCEEDISPLYNFHISLRGLDCGEYTLYQVLNWGNYPTYTELLEYLP